MHISKTQYDQHRRLAINLCNGNVYEADDLLHDTLMCIFESNTIVINSEHYINRSLKIAYWSNRSHYHNKIRKFNQISDEPTESQLRDYESVTVWLGDRITNEQLDILISRLPFFEREVFYLYALNDFSYNDLSISTGIPKKVLYNAVKYAKNEIKKAIVI
jgi:DNA-directed RNA polymerase specialized sigma24 family protein